MSTSGAGITFSGVGSGHPVQSWIDALIQVERQPVDKLYTKKNTYNQEISDIKSIQSRFSTLRSAVQKLTDASLSTAFDLFKSKTVTSSDTGIATVTASNSALAQNVTLKVGNLATATKATSNASIAQYMDGSENFIDVANGQGTTGVFNIYLNGVKKEITIAETDTLNDIVKNINDAYDPNADGNYSDNAINASISPDGKFQITYNNLNPDTSPANVILGSNADTSNFFNIMKLATASSADNGDGTSTFTSLDKISKVNLDGKLVGNAANLDLPGAITAGTFTIGQTEFTIDATTTLGGIVGRINTSDEAGVTARYDATLNKIILTSKTPGKTAINLEDGTSNFLSQAGLIESGNSMASQTMGTNAKVYINGSTSALEVNSNTITGDISGLAGVTINLKNTSSSTTAEGTAINITVDQDTDQLFNAVNDLLAKFNSMTGSVDNITAIGADLHGEYSLVNMKNSLRSLISDSVDGLTNYNSLAMVGITSGTVGKSVQDTTLTMQINKDTFVTALQANPSEVRALFIGDSAAGITGIMQQMETRLDTALDPLNGYFAARTKSLNDSITDTDKSILRGENRLTQYKAMITKQFTQMDQYVSKMQQQSSALSSIK